MAQAAIASRLLARTAYDVSKERTNVRANPTEGNINIRLLDAAVQQVKKDFAALGGAQINYIVKAALEDEERSNEIAEWTILENVHDLWFQGMEDKVETIKAVDRPAAEPELTPIQRATRLKIMIKSKQDEISVRSQLLETTVESLTGSISNLQLVNYKESCSQIVEKINEEMMPLYGRIQDLDPEQWQVYMNDASVFGSEVTRRMEVVKLKAVAKVDVVVTDTRGPTAAGGDVGRGAYAVYKKDDIPLFKGNPRSYPPFKREWQTLVAVGRSEEWQLTNLQKRTPEEIDLSNCTTAAEAWERLDDKYASPTLVSHELITEFQGWKPKAKGDASKLIELEHKLLTMFRDLEAVKQEKQISENLFLLSSTIKTIPSKYQDDLVKLRSEREGPDENLWKILKDFLEQKRKMIEKYSPWELDDKNAKQEENKGKTCDLCQSKSHLKKDCPKKRSWGKSSNAMNVKDDSIFKEKQKEYGPCPVCKKGHSFKNKAGYDLASNRLYDCPAFMAMSLEERAIKLEVVTGCASCTSWNHSRDKCTLASRPCGMREGTDQCQLQHNRAVHGTRVKYVNAFRARFPAEDIREAEEIREVGIKQINPIWEQKSNAVVFCNMLQLVWPHKVSTTLFLDDGSTCSIITHKLAGFLGLVGTPTTEFIEVAGRDFEELETMNYKLLLKDNNGDFHRLNLMGIDRITSNPGKMNVDKAYEIFPHVPKGALDRPSQEVGLLIGQDQVQLLATGGEGINQAGHLRVMNVKFGSGYVLGGYHESFHGGTPTLTKEAKKLTSLKFAKKIIQGKSINLIDTKKYPSFLEAEELGTEVPRRCERCVGCSRCSNQSQELTRKEQDELEMLQKNLVHDEDKEQVSVTYPIIGDIAKMRDNRYQAISMAKGLEKKMKKKGQLDDYNAVFKEFVERGVLVPVQPEDLESWKEQRNENALDGVVHYISHHGVDSDHSATTPLRLVANSAVKNCSTGPSANDLWPKGPNSINNLLKVLIRWRTYPVALVFDLSKAYQSILTTNREKFLRLVVWRYGDENSDWKTYGFNTMTFGDVPAAVILELVKSLAAQKYKQIDLVAAKRIENDSYVDDNLTGGDVQEVERMMGNCTKVDGKFLYDGTISQILEKVGLRAKVFVKSGENNREFIDKLGGQVLGHVWEPQKDEIIFRLKVNLYERKGGVRMGPDLTKDDLGMLETFMFTKRKILSVLNSFYDPMGLVCCYLIKFKIKMRDVTRYEKLEWDTLLSEKWQKLWRAQVKEVVLSEPVIFPRGVRPIGSMGRPEMIGYWDGSDEAYAAVIYIRWLIPKNAAGERWSAQLLTAKARVAPAGGITAPRSELNGFVVLGRLMNIAIKSLNEKPARITLIGDSECTISAYESHTASLAPYFSNRVIEVEDKVKGWGKKIDQESMVETEEEIVLDEKGETLLDLPFHTPGPLNPADIATRGTAEIKDMQVGSVWQTGPDYLKKSREEWPVSRAFRRQVPSGENRNKFYQMVNPVNNARSVKNKPSVLEKNRLYEILDYSDSWMKIRGIMARTLRALAKISKNSIFDPLTVEDYDRADQLMAVLAMKDTVYMMRNSDLSGLAPFWEGCVIYTKGRLGPNMKRVLGPDKLMVLSPRSRLATLIMTQAHREDHRRDGGDTLFRSRKFAWIVRGRPLADRVVKNCGFCKSQKKETLVQQMGNLPDEKFDIPCRPFSQICIDLTGPMEVVAMNNARSKLKTWPILFCCLNTGAIAIYVAAGASTSHFLTQYDHYVAVHGRPKFVYSDRGSNLTKAATFVQKDDPESWEWDKVAARAAKVGTKWKFAPAGCQYRDGLAESRVKALKKTLKHVTNGGPLNYAEFCSVLARAANIINDRPLGIRHQGGADGDLVPITPNLLLHTRTDSGDLGVDMYEDAPEKFTRRQQFMEGVLDLWWRMWYSQVFSSLVPFKKWKSIEENVKINDICLVKYENKVTRADYRLCKVVETEKDEKDLVRTVRVAMRPKNAKEKVLPYKSKDLVGLKVGVQRLVMVCPAEDIPAE